MPRKFLGGTPTVDTTALVKTDDSRLSDSRTPSGTAGGDLSGSYPNPTIGTGKVTSSHIADGTIVDGDISASAAIADSKLATISAAGKVSNSATTATNANTASAIVARDASGNFSAGTITAALTGNASTATKLQTARTIAGQSFDGSANITIAASDVSAVPLSTVTSSGDLIIGTGNATVGRLAVGATSGHVLTSNGSAAAPSWQAVASDQTWVIKSSDESVTSSSTFQDDDALTFSLAANAVYVFTALAMATSASATPGIKYQWTFPANAGVMIQVPASISKSVAYETTSPGGSQAAVGITAGGRTATYFVGHVYTGSTTGSLTLQWAQSSSNATATTLKAGSFIAYRKLV